MAAVLNMLARLRKSRPTPATEAATTAQDTAARSPGDMIAGCEYELRQLRRDVLQTRQRPIPPPIAKAREPFLRAPGRAAN
ncbi:MAG: hypothetical protein B7Y80_13400 [Hyphomicrobium sp. 32-62-53]|nr:MAG: hypothetical protein B7Z29_12820 [Hyphomicrobium sp. 12-62-95]OYX99025.1 MAG: hypothetical protein B7Y80_13400 [Hyphomicrobium sp. 32-62-53]